MSDLEGIYSYIKKFQTLNHNLERDINLIHELKCLIADLDMTLKVAKAEIKEHFEEVNVMAEIIEQIFLRINSSQLYIELAREKMLKLSKHLKEFLDKKQDPEIEKTNEKALGYAQLIISQILENKIYAKLIIESAKVFVEKLKPVLGQEFNDDDYMKKQCKIKYALEFHFKLKLYEVIRSMNNVMEQVNQSLERIIRIAKIAKIREVTVYGHCSDSNNIISQKIKITKITNEALKNMERILNERLENVINFNEENISEINMINKEKTTIFDMLNKLIKI